MANQGTGGKEDVNGANKPRTNVLYQEGYALESPEDLNINPPSADMVFAGWSTKSTYTTGEMLYQPGDNVSTVNWENYTDPKDLNKRPQLNGAQDKQKRELTPFGAIKPLSKSPLRTNGAVRIRMPQACLRPSKQEALTTSRR